MTELSLKIRGIETTAKVASDDLCVSEIVELLRGMLVSHGYVDQSFINVCKELADE